MPNWILLLLDALQFKGLIVCLSVVEVTVEKNREKCASVGADVRPVGAEKVDSPVF